MHEAVPKSRLNTQSCSPLCSTLELEYKSILKQKKSAKHLKKLLFAHEKMEKPPSKVVHNLFFSALGKMRNPVPPEAP